MQAKPTNMATQKRVHDGFTVDDMEFVIPDLARLSLTKRVVPKTVVKRGIHTYSKDEVVLGQNANYLVYWSKGTKQIFIQDKHDNSTRLLTQLDDIEISCVPLVDIHTDVYNVDYVLIHFINDGTRLSFFSIWQCGTGDMVLSRQCFTTAAFPSNLNRPQCPVVKPPDDTLMDTSIPECEDTPPPVSVCTETGAYRPIYIVLTTHWVMGVTTDKSVDDKHNYLGPYRIFFFPWRVFSSIDSIRRPEDNMSSLLTDMNYVQPFQQEITVGCINFVTTANRPNVILLATTKGVFFYDLALPIQMIIPLANPFFCGVNIGEQKHTPNAAMCWHEMNPKYGACRKRVLMKWREYHRMSLQEQKQMRALVLPTKNPDSMYDEYPPFTLLDEIEAHLMQNKKKRLEHKDMRVRTLAVNAAGDYIVCCHKHVILMCYTRHTDTMHVRRIDIGITSSGPQYAYISDNRVYIIRMYNGDIFGGTVGRDNLFVHNITELMGPDYKPSYNKNIRCSITAWDDKEVETNDPLTVLSLVVSDQCVSELHYNHTKTVIMQQLE